MYYSLAGWWFYVFHLSWFISNEVPLGEVPLCRPTCRPSCRPSLDLRYIITQWPLSNSCLFTLRRRWGILLWSVDENILVPTSNYTLSVYRHWFSNIRQDGIHYVVYSCVFSNSIWILRCFILCIPRFEIEQFLSWPTLLMSSLTWEQNLDILPSTLLHCNIRAALQTSPKGEWFGILIG